jgi:hypothetical protein
MTNKNVTIIEVIMEDDFTCKCGNNSGEEGFYPCDEEGNYREPDRGWNGHYKCDKCNQVYRPTNF